jgi:hypothetical protein
VWGGTQAAGNRLRERMAQHLLIFVIIGWMREWASGRILVGESGIIP